MEIKLLSCPLCLKPHFDGVDALRSSLISVATSQISCPVCNELLMGLDKLTIHLFSHITHNIVKQGILQADQASNLIHHATYFKSQTKTNCEDREILSNAKTEQVCTNKIEQETVNEEKCIEAANNLVEMEHKTVELNIPGENDDGENRIRCDICSFCFSDENILEIHQKLLHQTKADAETGMYSYHCHLCSKKFKMRGSLMVHLRVAHYGFGHVDSFQNARSSIRRNGYNFDSHASNDLAEVPNNFEQLKIFKNQDNKQWTCDVCSKLFTTKYFLKKHKRLHTGEMPYFCSQCNKSFTFQQSYHKHMLYHSSEKPHVCNECGRAFKELSTLHNHERIHSGERPFACETCGKCFRQRVSYLVHRRIHTGAMPYKCTACEKSFRYKVSQKSHKCPSNPPGLVVRAPDLVEKLLQKSSTKRIGDNLTKSVEILADDNTVLQKFSAKNGVRHCDYLQISTETDEKECNFEPSILQNGDINKKKEEKQADMIKQTEKVLMPNEIFLQNDGVSKIRENYTGPNILSNISSIVFNSEGQIIGQNFTCDGQDVIRRSSNVNQDVTNSAEDIRVTYVNEDSCENNGTYVVNINVVAENTEPNLTKYPVSSLNDDGSPDIFAMSLSPVLPDVQSLCLLNSSSEDETMTKIALETINEESFKKLLYGPTE